MDPHLNELTHEIIGSAIEVHRHLGPGLLESAYRLSLCRELLEESSSNRKTGFLSSTKAFDYPKSTEWISSSKMRSLLR